MCCHQQGKKRKKEFRNTNEKTLGLGQDESCDDWLGYTTELNTLTQDKKTQAPFTPMQIFPCSLASHLHENPFLKRKGTGSRLRYLLLSNLRILVGLHGFIPLPTLLPIGFGIVIMALDDVFMRVDLNDNFTKRYCVHDVIIENRGGGDICFSKYLAMCECGHRL